MPSMANVAVGAKITAANENTEIGWINTIGLTGIIPTSIAGAGVALAATGKVTFAAATTVSLNGCFTSTYDNYRLVLNVSSASAATKIQARLRLAGTDASGATDYGFHLINTSLATLTPAASGAQAQWEIGPAASAVSGRIDVDATLYSPALARKTEFVTAPGIAVNSPTTIYVTIAAGTHEQTVAYDGITLYPAAGNITGTVRVYGFNNL